MNYCIFGLFFCGKKIEIKNGKGNEIEIKECLPHVFICKDCMKKTKEKKVSQDNICIMPIKKKRKEKKEN